MCADRPSTHACLAVMPSTVALAVVRKNVKIRASVVLQPAKLNAVVRLVLLCKIHLVQSLVCRVLLNQNHVAFQLHALNHINQALNHVNLVLNLAVFHYHVNLVQNLAVPQTLIYPEPLNVLVKMLAIVMEVRRQMVLVISNMVHHSVSAAKLIIIEYQIMKYSEYNIQ